MLKCFTKARFKLKSNTNKRTCIAAETATAAAAATAAEERGDEFGAAPVNSEVCELL